MGHTRDWRRGSRESWPYNADRSMRWSDALHRCEYEKMIEHVYTLVLFLATNLSFFVVLDVDAMLSSPAVATVG